MSAEPQFQFLATPWMLNLTDRSFGDNRFSLISSCGPSVSRILDLSSSDRSFQGFFFSFASDKIPFRSSSRIPRIWGSTRRIVDPRRREFSAAALRYLSDSFPQPPGPPRISVHVQTLETSLLNPGCHDDGAGGLAE